MPAAKRQRSRSSKEEILDLNYLATNSSLDGMLSHLKPELRNFYADAFPSLPSISEITRIPPRGVEPTPLETTPHEATRGAAKAGVEINIVEALIFAGAETAGVVSTGAEITPPSVQVPSLLERIGPVIPAGVATAPAEAKQRPPENAVPPAEPNPSTGMVSTGTTIKLPRGMALFRWREAQECHTRGEEQVRSRLWLAAHNPKDDNLDRFAELPLSQITRLCGMSETQTRLALRGLVEKLAIVLEQGYREAGQSRRYRIRSFRNLNAARRESGLIWVLRNGPGVRVLTDSGSQAVLQNFRGMVSTPAEISYFLDPRAAETTSPAGPETAGAAGPETAPPLKESIEVTKQRTSSTAQAAVRQGVARYFTPLFDDDAVSQVIEETLSQVPDITDPELQQLTEYCAQIANQLFRANKLTGTWTGFIIKRTPRLAQQVVTDLREKARKEQEVLRQFEQEGRE